MVHALIPDRKDVIMEAEELYKKMRTHPFESFRIYISDGHHYDIKHPDQIMVGKRTSYVGMSRKGQGPFQDVAIISNVHIARIEPINGKTTTRKKRRKK